MQPARRDDALEQPSAGVTTLSQVPHIRRTIADLHGCLFADGLTQRAAGDAPGPSESTSQAEYAGSIPVIGSTLTSVDGGSNQKFWTAPPPTGYGETRKRPQPQPVEQLGIAIRVLGTNRSAHLLESWADSNALKRRVEGAVPLLIHRNGATRRSRGRAPGRRAAGSDRTPADPCRSRATGRGPGGRLD
ncbi:MAG: hypothetical protein QOD10_5840 [Mycobacterium sp.]|jgi:hypothetical protein|nr:hypothetical protein [Mycobacterium sp.]